MSAVLERPVPTGRPEPRFRLRRRAHKVALTAHVLTSVGWFGVAAMVAFVAIVADTTRDPEFAHSMYRTLEMFPWLSIPLGAAAVVTGAILSLGTKYGFIRHWWVVAKIAISIAVIVTDALLLARFAHSAAVDGTASTPLAHGAVAHVVVLAVATVLSVFKPRGLTAWGRRRRDRAATQTQTQAGSAGTRST